MNKLIEAIKAIDKKELIQKLIHSEFAFAQWRMPGSDKETLIVSLEAPSQVEPELSKLDKGFIVNSFSKSHPSFPFLIKADLVFDGNTLEVDPRIDASQLEAFESRIESAVATKKEQPQQIKFDTPEDFTSMVALAVDLIKQGNMDKVVLSRYKDVLLPQDFSADRFFKKIAGSYPNAFCNLFFIPSQGLWIGATPELLLSENDRWFKTHALAGTKPLNHGQSLSEISWTQKEIEEQAMVSRYIIDCFKKIRLREFKEVGPRTVKAGNLAHLKTTYEVDFQEVNFENLADQMLELLHPTSAVCGMPRQAASEFIERAETYDRAFYSGFLGPVNFEGSTDLFVNLRCMRVDDQYARLFAGAGITRDSDPEKEWTETEIKMSTLYSLLF